MIPLLGFVLLAAQHVFGLEFTYEAKRHGKPLPKSMMKMARSDMRTGRPILKSQPIGPVNKGPVNNRKLDKRAIDKRANEKKASASVSHQPPGENQYTYQANSEQLVWGRQPHTLLQPHPGLAHVLEPSRVQPEGRRSLSPGACLVGRH